MVSQSLAVFRIGNPPLVDTELHVYLLSKTKHQRSATQYDTLKRHAFERCNILLMLIYILVAGARNQLDLLNLANIFNCHH